MMVAMDQDATVRIDDQDGIALVTIDRPPANAMNPQLLTDGLAVLDQLTADPPRAVVLTGAGSFFCGGADLRVVPFLEPDAAADMARDINKVFAGWYDFARPLVCAVNGHAVAGGLILALCGDHRVVGHTGRFGLTEVKVGIPYPSEAMAVVQAELPPATARRLVLRAELHDAATAVALGVFDEQVPDDQVLTRAMAVAAEMAELPTATFEVSKRRLRAGRARTSGMFGGADETHWAVSEAAVAATAVLDGPRAEPPR
jgi:enoyl-CoA hydratase